VVGPQQAPAAIGHDPVAEDPVAYVLGVLRVVPATSISGVDASDRASVRARSSAPARSATATGRWITWRGAVSFVGGVKDGDFNLPAA
jgi:hypothetical protein